MIGTPVVRITQSSPDWLIDWLTHLSDDWRTCWQELDQHDDGAVQVDVSVVKSEFNKDRPRPDVQPIRRRELIQLCWRHAWVTTEIKRVAATLQ